ncbi:MAG TPA: hypothetical protein VHA35_10680 [Dongiaceae bacterium]|jgi:hypothetical protein|nr:hypothetical protein [Dongiaceae bacterium]
MAFLSIAAPQRIAPAFRIKLIAVFDLAVVLGLGWLIVASDLFS